MHPTPSLPLRNGAFFVDNSFIESWVSCPRKSEYGDLMKRRSTGVHSALTFGSAIHLALDYRYAKFGVDLDIVSKALCEDGQRRLLEAFFAENATDGTDHRDLNWAMEVVQQYNIRYMIEPFNLLNDQASQPMVEVPFAVPFAVYDRNGQLKRVAHDDQPGLFDPEQTDRIPIIYCGKIDLPVLYDSTDLVVVDHKTGSTIGAQYWDRHRMSSQFVGYCWGMWRTTGRLPVGFMINGIRTKAKPLTKPRNGWDAWWEENFQRNKEYINETHIAEWEENTFHLLDEFFWHHQKGYFPMHRQNCAQYGRCEFYDVCFAAKESRQELLEGSMFTENTWNPLEIHKDKYKNI